MPTHIRVPNLVRIKPGALKRLGLYLQRQAFQNIFVFSSPLPDALAATARTSLSEYHINPVDWIPIDDNSFEQATRLFAHLPKGVDAIVGIGGGKALDAAKYLAFLARLPYFAAPTSLSNDGFCSPQSSLTIEGRRKSLPAALPQGVILDVTVCLEAPKSLWLSGVGDLVSKLTAVTDWKLAFHATGEPVNDLAALLSDATVHQFIAAPTFDARGTTLLGTALMLNGIAMEICGSSRPASGSEHLISHALDSISGSPRLHGLQVGLASYLVSLLQNKHSAMIDQLFQKTGFWEFIRKEPFSLAEWDEALRLAPTMKEDFFTVLSKPDSLHRAQTLLREEARLAPCFTSTG